MSSAPAEQAAPVATPVPVIAVHGVVKVYAGGTRALDGVDLTIQPGEFVALTGPSGCGKSTLLNLIAALDAPTEGSVVVNGVDLATVHDLSRYRREQVGLVFQLHNLIPQVSVAANIEVAMFATHRSSHERRARALELIEALGLSGRQDRLPTHLSGGERQRVAIARALANEPQIILADEPTGSLDTASSARLLETFRALNASGVSILMVTHDQAVAAAAGRRVAMEDGRVVAG
jgi:putative ABC transport system ATP-binding protein